MNLRQVSAVCAMTAWLAVQPALAQNQGQSQGTQPSPPPASTPQFNATVTVVGVTPLPGLGVPLNRVPSNVQVASGADLARTPGVHLGAQLGDALASVHLNEAQSSTFQPDVQFRGFASSPLLGLPQGLAVYQDGVRVNEPFGDTVNWDALPSNAIGGRGPDARFESALRPQRARRRAVDPDQDRLFASGTCRAFFHGLVWTAVGGTGERRACEPDGRLFRGGPLAPGGRLARPLTVTRHAGIRQRGVAVGSRPASRRP